MYLFCDYSLVLGLCLVLEMVLDLDERRMTDEVGNTWIFQMGIFQMVSHAIIGLGVCIVLVYGM